MAGIEVLAAAVLAGVAVAVGVGGPWLGRLAAILPRARLGSGAGSSVGSGAGGQNAIDGPGWSRAAKLGIALSGLALLLWVGPAGAAAAMALTMAVCRAVRQRRAAALRTAERVGSVEACAVLAAELKAGRCPAEALEAAAAVATGPAATALATAAAAVPFGGDVPQVLTAAAARSAVPDLLRGLAACWSVCSTTGAGLATAVDRLADGLRSELRQRREVEAELAAPRATAALLALLPLVGTLLAAGLGARPLQVLLHTPVGSGCLLLGVALDLAGLWWTGKIVAAAGGAR